MLTHLLIVVAFSAALMLWFLFQRWLDRAEPQVQNVWVRGCGGCSHGQCGTGRCPTGEDAEATAAPSAGYTVPFEDGVER
ncbi:MAG: hypothetical protein KC613_18310 [Myxococcales bacterium]|nr:hypothetical protein [Myxococcales bacterium]MCB2100592.1 hypothetical protein [Rhodobacterales bacterium]MCB9526119.1 hypothetical protein [Myxococcales bacterium]